VVALKYILKKSPKGDFLFCFTFNKIRVAFLLKEVYMGFEVKMLFVIETKKETEKKGPNGETTCVVWEDTFTGIDFGRVTRLEKLTSKRFAHLTWTPFKHAGICVIDCFFRNIFADFDKNTERWFAPEILVYRPLPLYVYREDEDPPEPTEKVGGNLYLDCSVDRLKGRSGNEELIAEHNTFVVNHQSALQLQLFESAKWSIMEPPLIWVPCTLLAEWLTQAEEQKTEGWKALVQDRVSLAIFLGWRHLLREMGEVDARALFRFS
jgi:hypothetical protein